MKQAMEKLNFKENEILKLEEELNKNPVYKSKRQSYITTAR